MKIDRLIDSWSDPLLSLYEREVRILMTGIVFTPNTSKIDFSDLVRRIYSMVISQRRNNLLIQSAYTNFSVFSDEELEIKIAHSSGKNIESSVVKLDYENKVLVNIYDSYRKKYHINNHDVLIKITLIKKGDARLRFEKMVFKDSPEKVAMTILNRINKFIERVHPKSEFMEFYNYLLGDKDLLSLEIIDNRISLDDDEVLILDQFVVEKTKELRAISFINFKNKSDYLDMFEESLKSNLREVFK